MQILPSEYRERKFRDLPKAEGYQRALQMKQQHDNLVADVLQLDNRPGLDLSNLKGIVLLSGVQVGSINHSPGVHEILHDSPGQIRASARGSLNAEVPGRVEYEFGGAGHHMSGTIGENTWEVHSRSKVQSETARFLADGTIEYILSK